MSPAFAFPDARPTRPLWLMTLADLALLLVGFMVLVHATTLDKTALAKGLRAGFNVAEPASALPVAAAAVDGFAPGSAVLPGDRATMIAWARDAARDPRVSLRIAGAVDGSAADTDPLLHSSALLAADRARAVAALLVGQRVIAAGHIQLVTQAMPGGRRVLVTLAYSGDAK